MRIRLERPSARRAAEFLTSVRRSRRVHRPWVYPPSTPEDYRAYLRRLRRPSHEGYFVVHDETGDLVGVSNLNEIVRGNLQSAFLGFYALVPYVGQGLMMEGLREVVRVAFWEVGLHRLEANIQPGNGSSLRLVERLGFAREGLSPGYLKVGGRWRDHERWALVASRRGVGAKGELAATDQLPPSRRR